MTVLIKRLDRNTQELKPIARVDSGRITHGADAISDLLVDGQVPTEAELLDRFRGPTLFAAKVDPGNKTTP